MLGKLNKYQQRCADNLLAWEAYRNQTEYFKGSILPAIVFRENWLGDRLRFDKDRVWLLVSPSLQIFEVVGKHVPQLRLRKLAGGANQSGEVLLEEKTLTFMEYAGTGKTAHGSTAVATFRETVPFASVQLTFHKITPGLNDEDFYAKVPEARGALSVLEWDVDAGNPSYGDLASLGLHALEVLKNHLLRRKTNPFNIEKLFRARGIL